MIWYWKQIQLFKIFSRQKVHTLNQAPIGAHYIAQSAHFFITVCFIPEFLLYKRQKAQYY